MLSDGIYVKCMYDCMYIYVQRAEKIVKALEKKVSANHVLPSA